MAMEYEIMSVTIMHSCRKNESVHEKKEMMMIEFDVRSH